MRNMRFLHIEKADHAHALALDCQLKRLPGEQPRQSVGPFALVIRWVETGELRLQVTLGRGTALDSARIGARSAPVTAFSRARPRIRPARPGSPSNGSCHDKRKSKNQRLWANLC